MKIAIHNSNYKGFSDRWITYCKEKNIPYKLVNAYDTNIIEQISDCDAFMWHFHHADYRDMQFAKGLIRSLETKGVKCFPNSNTCWHFDNKVFQKYLLECIDAPLVPSYVFYSPKEALEWIKQTSFPKVFKLKGGAGSSNVRLAHTCEEAVAFVKKAFRKGFTQYDWKSQFKEQRRKYKVGKATLRELLRPLYYSIKRYPTVFTHYHQNEIGYAYFQDYIPDNKFDIRVCVVGCKAFALKRICREGDFRASGGGDIVYHKDEIDDRCVQIAFDTNMKLKTQSIALDFVFDKENNPLIVEISYGYSVKLYDLCEGYWTSDMKWHAGTHFDICGWMVENLIENEK